MFFACIQKLLVIKADVGRKRDMKLFGVVRTLFTLSQRKKLS